ncbi:hypothetical protein C8J95_106281 [Elizabethkingia sp. YR214]|nr:hypothetical protein C8J95_106281 [Elizabethkingia sp. YR214]
MLTFACIVVNAQLKPNYNTPNIPTSPEVTSLMRYGAIPIGYFTGNIQPSIPIYTIKESGIEIPISLNYSSSGIRLSDQSTWVGLGWNLSPEGQITQEVRGRNDQHESLDKITTSEYNILYDRFKNLPPLGQQKVDKQIGTKNINISTNIGNGVNVSCAEDPPGYQIEPQDPQSALLRLEEGGGQPDIYNFNFLGHSGDFYINPDTKEVVQLNKKEEVKFEIIFQPYRTIKATTSDGFIYYFGAEEVIYYNGNQAMEQYNNYSYKLTDIITPSGKKISFEYQDAIYNNIYYTQNFNLLDYQNYDFLGGVDFSYSNPSFNNYKSDIKILKRITTEDCIITFNLDDREDFLSSDKKVKKLSSIDISTNSGKKIKSYSFGQSYFAYDETLGMPKDNPIYLSNNKNAFGKRLKLDSLNEIFYKSDGTIDTSSTRTHNFEYNTQRALPSKLSFSKDLWGFFNNSLGKSLVPDLDYFTAVGFIKPLTPIISSYKENSNNRFSDNTFGDIYLLNKIKYPTGGYTSFYYEPNTFENQFIPTQFEVSSSRKNINLNNNGDGGSKPKNNTYEFTINNTTEVKINNEIFRGIPNSPLATKAYTYYEMLNNNASIKLYKVENNTDNLYKIWDLNTILSSAFESSNYARWNETLNLPSGKYKLILNINNNMYDPSDVYHLAGVISNLEYFLPPTAQIASQVGVRIKSVENYDPNSSLLKKINYKYQGGVLNNRFDIKQNFSTENDNRTGYQRVHEAEYYTISGEDYNNLVTYSNVTEEDIDIQMPTKTKGSKTYSFHNFENKSYPWFPIVKNPLSGLPVLETTYESGKSILSKKIQYKDISNNLTFISAQALKIYVNDSPIFLNKNNGNCYPKYYYYITPLVQNFIKTETINTEEIYSNGKTTAVDSYEYKNNGNLLLQRINFGDTSSTTTYQYAHEKGNQYLIDKNMIGIPLQTSVTQKQNDNDPGKTISKSEILYPTSQADANARTSGLALPVSVLGFDLQNPEDATKAQTELTYDLYDNKGNILQYSVKGKPVTVIWGYGQTQPIAKIEGAAYNQVSAYVSAIIAASDADNTQGTDQSEQALIGALDLFRNNTALSTYQITTYTYNPLIGVTSITPPSGVWEIYKYDSANRLESVKDVNGNLLKEYQYRYKN